MTELDEYWHYIPQPETDAFDSVNRQGAQLWAERQKLLARIENGDTWHSWDERETGFASKALALADVERRLREHCLAHDTKKWWPADD